MLLWKKLSRPFLKSEKFCIRMWTFQGFGFTCLIQNVKKFHVIQYIVKVKWFRHGLPYLGNKVLVYIWILFFILVKKLKLQGALKKTK